MPTTATTTYSGQKLEPFIRPDAATMISVKIKASQNIAKGTILGEQVGTNAKQTILVTGAPTGGYYTLTFGAQTTGHIAYNAEASDVQAALEALSSIGAGNVRVTGGPSLAGPFTVEFVGALGGAAAGAITKDATNLTGGTSPDLTITTNTQVGAAGTPGTFAPYSETATDGSQVASAIAVYDMQTDASGNVTFSSTASQSGGPHGETYKTAPVYVSGYFNTADLTGLNAAAVPQLGRLEQGTLSSGILRVL